MKRNPVAEIITLCVLFLVLGLIVVPPRGVVDRPETGQMPPPTHIVWTEYPVGGMLLVNPSMPDSMGTIVVPAGSMLMVPTWVAGEAPEKTDSKS